MIVSGEFTGERQIELVADLAALNFISDIPEAIKNYKYEIELCGKYGLPVPDVAIRSIAVLEDYSHKILDEGKYLPLGF